MVNMEKIIDTIAAALLTGVKDEGLDYDAPIKAPQWTIMVFTKNGASSVAATRHNTAEEASKFWIGCLGGTCGDSWSNPQVRQQTITHYVPYPILND